MAIGASHTADESGFNMGRAALAFARGGYRVFPCLDEGKAPATRRGMLEATTDTGQVARWWRWRPWANIGLRTGEAPGAGGVDVLDIDVHGADGFAALERLRRAGLVPEPLVEVVTGSGGRHLYFPARPGQRSWSEGRAGIDLRAGGGYVIAPPSIVRQPDGGYGRYVTERVGSGAPGMLDGGAVRALLRPSVPARPDGLVRPPGAQCVSERGLATWMASRPEGQRNASLFWAACRLVEAGTDMNQAGELRDAARAAGLPDAEIEGTLRSAERVAGRIAPAADADTASGLSWAGGPGR